MVYWLGNIKPNFLTKCQQKSYLLHYHTKSQSAVSSFDLHRLDCKPGGLPDSGNTRVVWLFLFSLLCLWIFFFFFGSMPTMMLFFILERLFKGLNVIMFRILILTTYQFLIKSSTLCFGVIYISNQLGALMETLIWYLYAVWYGLSINSYIAEGVANFINNKMFKQASRFSTQFLICFWNALSMTFMLTVLSVCLNVLLLIYIIWRKLSPNPENTEQQRVCRSLGEILERGGPPMSLSFTLEHLQNPENLSKYLSQ